MDEKLAESKEKPTIPVAEISKKRQSRKRKLNESSNQETSTDDQAPDKPKMKVIAIENGGQREVVKQTEEKQQMSSAGEKENQSDKVVKSLQLTKCGLNISRDDSGKDSESRRSSDGSTKDFPKKPKEASISEDVVMESTSDRSQNNNKLGLEQDKSMKAKSSDLGTDLSLSPSSIDVDIDDVLGILSPSSPRNDSMLEDGKGGCKYSRWNFQQIQLPNLAQQSKLPLPLPEYLPESIAQVVKDKEEKKEEEKVEKKKEDNRKEGTAAQVAQTDILQELAKVSEKYV